jgi:prepilin-type N-terminal cleavage/methylation domain-containing protein
MTVLSGLFPLLFNVVIWVYRGREGSYSEMLKMLHAMKRESEKGFTLLEVMIALGILAVGILAIISMHIAATQANAHAVTFTNALLAAQSRIEYLLMDDFDDITSGTYTETHADMDVIPPGYSLEWEAKDITADLKKIYVTVKKSVKLGDKIEEKALTLTVMKNRG